MILRLIFCLMFVLKGPLVHGKHKVSEVVSFMQRIGDQVTKTLKEKEGEAKRSILRALFKKHVHHKSVAKFVLGNKRRMARSEVKKAQPSEREKVKTFYAGILKRFYAVYRESIVRIYLSAFEKEYKNEEFKATHARKNGKDGAIAFSTLDRKNGAPPLKLQWILKHTCDKEKKTKQWKIVDLRVEGVSQAGKERSEAMSIINKHHSQCRSEGGDLCAIKAIGKFTDDHHALNHPPHGGRAAAAA